MIFEWDVAGRFSIPTDFSSLSFLCLIGETLQLFLFFVIDGAPVTETTEI